MPDDDSASEVVFPHADSSPRASHVAAWQSLAWDALVESAHSLARAGRRADARAAYELALARLPEAGDSAVASSLARWVARTWQVDADHDVALDCIEAAEAIALAFRDQVAYGHALNVRAIVSWQRGELDEAQRLYSQCLDIALRESDAHLAATASQNLGIIANVRGDLDQALHHYCASLEGYRALGHTRDISTVQNNLGRLFSERAQWSEADAAFHEAFDLAAALGETSSCTMIELNVAEMWVGRRDFEQAEQACVRAMERATDSNDSHADGEGHRIRGIIARERKEFERAEGEFERADQVAIQREDLLLRAHIARERAELYRTQGRLKELVQTLHHAQGLFGRLRAQRAVAEVERLSRRVEQDFLHVVQRWGESIEEKDQYTQGHCERVANIACDLAARCGVEGASLFWLRVGSLLHDVGKIDIDPAILNKPGRLSADEWVIMKRHPAAGVDMLREVGLPDAVLPAVRSHHENWDGSGYPDGLRGERIPMWARIACVADVYDALTSERSYKKALSHAETMEVMRRDVGRQFDPALFHAFEEMTRVAPPAMRAATARSGADGTLEEHPVTGALPDDLTGLPLRKSFLASTAMSIAASAISARPTSLLVIDVDHFKLVNDTYGHLQGDDVLCSVAAALVASVRKLDLVGRYAGDEFVVLLPDTEHALALEVAERIRATVEGVRLVVRERREATLGVTLSIGVATSDAATKSTDDLFAAADRGLYAAKRRGRNAVASATETDAEPETPALDFERFVGRVTELRTLIRGLEKASTGKPQLINVVGEAGVGKSTLVRQLHPEVRLRGGAMVSGRFIQADVKPPYGPWAEVLEDIHRMGLVPQRPWPELRRLVPMLDPDGRPDSSPGSKYALLAELAEFLRIASERTPLVVVLDDVQWGDASSWDALEFVLQQLSHERLLICLTTRVEDADAIAERCRRLSRDERTSELPLQRLTLAELRLWIETVFHQGSVGDAFPRFLHDYTEGNPLLVVHVLRSLLEDGSIWYAGRRWQWNDTPELKLPRGVGDLITARVSRLSDMARRHLALGAIVGRTFDVDVVLDAGEMSEDDLLDAIDEGVAANVVDGSAGGDGIHYSFAHGLIAEAMRAILNPRRQARAHERVACAIERLRPTAVADIAAHFDAAGNSAKAFEYSLLSAERAVAVYAHNEAAASFAVAQRHAPTAEQKLDARYRQATALELAGRYEEGEALCDLMIADEVASGRGQGLFAVRRLRERVRLVRGQPIAATRESCERLLNEVEQLGDRTEEVLVLGMLSRIYHRLGEPTAAQALARRAVSGAELNGSPKLLADTLAHLGASLIDSDAAEAVLCFERALETFESIAELIPQARCHINIGIARSQLGESDASLDSYTRALNLGRSARTPDVIGLASLNLGVLLLKIGRFAEAEASLTEAMHGFLTVHNEAHRLAAIYNLANLARERDDQPRAAELYGEAAVVAASVSQSDVEMGARAGQGLAFFALGRDSDARACLRTADVLLSRRPDWWFQGRELLAALRIKAQLQSGDVHLAERSFYGSLAIAEQHDLYGAAWLVAEVATELVAAGVAGIAEQIARFRGELTRLNFVPLTARYERMGAAILSGA